MARIRSIKPEFWTSRQVVECSPTARLLFVGLWNFCDDAGRHVADEIRLKMEVFPADMFDAKVMRTLVEELISVGLLREYESQGKLYWQVTGWHHQKIDKPTIKYPAPEFDEPSPSIPRVVVEPSPPEGKGVEGKGVEGKGVEGERKGKELQEPPIAPQGAEGKFSRTTVNRDFATVCQFIRDDAACEALCRSEFKGPFLEWFTYRQIDCKKPMTLIGWKAQCRHELAPLGVQKAIAAFNHSIANGYQGVIPVRDNNKPQEPYRDPNDPSSYT